MATLRLADGIALWGWGGLLVGVVHVAHSVIENGTISKGSELSFKLTFCWFYINGFCDVCIS